MPGAATPGGVRAHPDGAATVLEGDAEGIPALAAHGLLDPTRPLLLAGDAEGSQLSRLLEAGSTIVLTDSARRRTFVAPRLRSNRGPTLGPDDPISPDSPRFEAFPARGSEGRTVALYPGVRRVYSPAQPGFSQFPQYRPFAALDGRLDTSWLADENVRAREWFLELDLERPRRLRSFFVTPHVNRYGRTARIAVSVNGGPERFVDLRRGRNRIDAGAEPVSTLRIRIARIIGDEDRRGAGGIAELEVPGLRTDERLRLPTALTRRLRGRDLSANPLAITLERTTADFPGRAGTDTGEPEDRSSVGMLDAESGLEREVDLPAARSFLLTGWAGVRADAPDPAIDRLVGVPAAWRFSSSSRFEGLPGRRASSAFDGDSRTAWVANLPPGGTARLQWSGPRALTLRNLRLHTAAPQFASPARVKVSTDGGPSEPALVSPSGQVRLRRGLRGRSFRVDVTAARRSPQARRRGLNAVAVSELSAPGLRPPAIRRGGRFAAPCGAIRAVARPGSAAIAVRGTVAALAAGRPLALSGCSRLKLGEGRARISVPAGEVMTADHLALRSLAPNPVARAAFTGRVVSVDGGGPGAPKSAELALTGPSWIVLNQSYNRGWRATCRTRSGDERSLGEPVPMDGYANGWRAARDCRRVDFAFAPQATANAGFGLSALTALVLLAVALWPRRKPIPASPADAEAERTGRAGDPVRRLGWRIAVPAALAAGAAGALLFALRMGPVIAVLTLVLLLAGVSVKRLVRLSLGALVMVVALYLVFPAEDKGGFSFQFATDHLVAHWVAVVAVCLLAGAAVLAAQGMNLRERRMPRR